MKFILVMLIFSNEKAEKIYVKISITTDELSCFSLDIKWCDIHGYLCTCTELNDCIDYGQTTELIELSKM